MSYMPGEIPLRLTSAERDLILHHIVPMALVNDSVIKLLGLPGPVTIRMARAEWGDLAGYVAAEANHAETEMLQTQLKRLHDRICTLADLDGDVPPLEECALSGSDDAPRNVMDDLMFELSDWNWDSASHPMRLSDGLAIEELKDASFFHNARTLMTTMVESDGVPLTGKGFLIRKVVADMLQRGMGLYDPNVHSGNCGPINEFNVPQLRAVRATLEIASLVYKRKQRLRVAKANRQRLADEAAGSLYRRLFVGLMHDIDWDMFNPFTWAPNLLQEGVPHMLFSMAQVHEREWADREEWAQFLLPASVYDSLHDIGDYMPAFTMEYDFLRSLYWLGIVERKVIDASEPYLPRYAYRTTPLLHRFVSFRMQSLLRDT